MKVKVMRSPIIICTVNELVRVCPERIVYICSDGNYSTMVLHDETEQVFSFNLSHFQQIIERQMKEEAALFIRIGKSLMRCIIGKPPIAYQKKRRIFCYGFRSGECMSVFSMW